MFFRLHGCLLTLRAPHSSQWPLRCFGSIGDSHPQNIWQRWKRAARNQPLETEKTVPCIFRENVGQIGSFHPRICRNSELSPTTWAFPRKICADVQPNHLRDPAERTLGVARLLPAVHVSIRFMGWFLGIFGRLSTDLMVSLYKFRLKWRWSRGFNDFNGIRI